MKEIELTQGQIALIDDQDYDYLNQWKWYAQWALSNNSYYAQRSIRIELKRTLQFMHRVILERKIGRELYKGEQVDHINHDTLDNRRENLRLATRSQNLMNRIKQQNNTSGYKGVSWHKHSQKWRATIKIGSRHTHLGLFDTPKDAYDAYCKAADELHGEFAYYE